MADNLASFIDQADFGDAEGANDNDVAIIITPVRRRASSQAGIGCLHDNDLVRRDTGLEHSPLLAKVAGPNYRQDWPISKSEAPTVAEGSTGLSQHVAGTDD
jgi:hypothetical protein